MRKNEQRIWDTMRRNCPPDIWLERVENLVGEGIPDVRAMRKGGVEVWLELKYATRPKRITTPLLRGAIRTSQKNWHEKHAQFGGVSFIVVRDSMKALYLIPGALVRELDDLTFNDIRAEFQLESWNHLFKRAL